MHAVQGAVASGPGAGRRRGESLARGRRLPARSMSSRCCTAATQVIHDLNDDVQLPWLDDKGITLVRGQGRLDGDRRVEVGDRVLEAARAVVIAVGSGAAIPPIDGLEEISPWTNRAATTAHEAPATLTVLGGGAVGCELAQAWATLGSKVTQVEAESSLIPKSEPFAAALLAESSRELGIDVRTGAQVTHASQGRARLHADARRRRGAALRRSAGRRRPHAAHRRPRPRHDRPQVRDHRRRRPHAGPLPRRLAVRDRRRQRPRAGHARRQVPGADRLRDDHEPTRRRPIWDGPLSPRVVYTDPQIAAVGLTLEQALADGRPGPRGRRRPRSDGGRELHRQGRAQRRADRRRRRAGGDRRRDVRRSPRSPRACTPPRSRWSARCRCARSCMRSRRSRRAARCGCSCWRTGPPDPRSARSRSASRARQRRVVLRLAAADLRPRDRRRSLRTAVVLRLAPAALA